MKDKIQKVLKEFKERVNDGDFEASNRHGETWLSPDEIATYFQQKLTELVDEAENRKIEEERQPDYQQFYPFNEIVQNGITNYYYEDFGDYDEIEVKIQNEGGCVTSIELTNMTTKPYSDRIWFCDDRFTTFGDKEFVQAKFFKKDCTMVRIKVVNTDEDRCLWMTVNKYFNTQI